MRTIIAGSRDCTDKRQLLAALAACGWIPTTVISGAARGADRMGEMWAASVIASINKRPTARYMTSEDGDGCKLFISVTQVARPSVRALNGSTD